ncbi:MAG: cupredoxin family copper-binding protein [Patescibacteria group bacterium]
MTKKIIIVLVIVVIGFVIYDLAFKNNANKALAPAPESNVPVNNVSNNVPESKTASVSMKNFAFNPATLSVKAGIKVTWTNNDSVPHTVTSDSDNLLNSPTLAPGESFSFTFANSGTYSYHCKIHPMMKGVGVVN